MIKAGGHGYARVLASHAWKIAECQQPLGEEAAVQEDRPPMSAKSLEAVERFKKAGFARGLRKSMKFTFSHQ